MNLRFKTLLGSSIATVILIAGLSTGLSYLILHQLSDMEKRTMSRRLDQCFQFVLGRAGIEARAARPRQQIGGRAPIPMPGAPQGRPDEQTGAPEERMHGPEQGMPGPPRGPGGPAGFGPGGPNEPGGPGDSGEPGQGGPPNQRGSSPDEAVVLADAAVLADSRGALVPIDPSLGGTEPTGKMREVLTHLPKKWATLPVTDSLEISPDIQLGLIEVEGQLFLIVQRPWPPTSAENLHLITVHSFDPENLQAGELDLKGTFLKWEDPQVPNALHQANPPSRVASEYTPASGDAGLPPSIRTVNGDVQYLALYLLLKDVSGHPLGVIRAISPNPFYAAGKEGVRILTAFICLTGLAFGISLNLLLDRWVLSRVSSLGGQLRTVQGSSSALSGVHLPGTDELSHLATDINSMLRRLEESQRLEEQNREMTALNAELQRLNQLKDEFLANTSHELRTPLNGMIGIAESMRDGATGALTEEQRYNLSLITRSGKRLTNLVNDILDFSKMRHRELDLDLRPVGLRPLVDMVLQLSRPLVGTKDLRLVNDIPANLPPVLADESRLQQVLHNLIGNAIKFTPSGLVRISAEIHHPRGGEPEIRVSIMDTGIGIPADKLDRIFESFEQVEGSARRQYGGTGLGLTITRNLLELHGGTIQVDSKLGEGSVFTFTLPVSLEADLSAEASHTWSPAITEESLTLPAVTPDVAPVSTDGLAPHVLIVDDEPVNLQVVKNFLSLQKYTLTMASDGQEALALLERGLNPDIILLDVMMPQMTGYEVIQTIREKSPADQLPIILLSARSQPEDIVLGLEVGANDYLTKPISKEELIARIHTHLQIRRLAEETIRLTVEHERQLVQFLDALPVGVSVHNPDGSAFYRNQLAKQILPTESDTTSDSESLPIARALRGESLKEELEIQQGDRIIPLEVVGAPIRDERGTVVHAIAAFQDISERRRAERVSQELREAMVARERLESELTIAAQIQRSMVPHITPTEDPTRRYDLAALFQPARMVGGDFYDYFPLGDDRLCVIIGDVADKGVPAALLMARTVTLVRTLALPTSSPVDILQAVNQELCVNNDECLFATLFCGILSQDTGILHYASAGHDAPILVRGGEVHPLPLETGPPVGLDTEAIFPPFEHLLRSDDLVVLFTDGITEAMSPSGEMVSEERLIAAIATDAPGDPAQAVHTIQALHQSFVQGAAQSDDLTLLVLAYRPAETTDMPSTEEWNLSLTSELPEMETAKERLGDLLREQAIGEDAIGSAQLIAEEILVNIINYGYDGEGGHSIDLKVSLTPERLQTTYVDVGKPFNPLTEIYPPDLEMDDDLRSSGGLGFYLVRELSEDIEYSYRDGKNVLVVTQSLTEENGAVSR